ncbi:restriction endonuclease subunit S [Aeromonas sp. LsrichE-8G]|uniref:restriction endonuclease subunit S n=1 Tax=Aeromonas sp. LsrichE-8G TaxID=2932048 RepID=UPI001FD5165B|nr:restriction endonuclease subunit S [Aeromonas sp. LsrichE-8G]MCJ7929982.1 restriction endonuclease subunit S [Aeromonas sp. LsrichE-8G]
MSEVVATQQQGLTGKYHSYPEYKDSGIAWLGNAPSHWAVFHGKRLLTQCRETARPESTQLAASQAYGVIPQSLLMEMTGNKVMLALKGTDNFKHVSENDFVISLRSFEGGIEHSSYSGCVSPAYTVLQAVKPIYPWFYRYLFKSSPYIAALQASTDSLRDGKSITFEQFGAISLPLPSHEEQRTIAAFLDYETARIDRLIAQQQRLIELLKEKRQAVISHAVTKGLNPDAPMKDSGIEWLGQVPEHWVVSDLSYTLSAIADIDHYMPESVDIGVPYLMTGDLKNFAHEIDFSECKQVSYVEYGKLSRKIQASIGDVIVARYATIGTATYVDIDKEFLVSYACVTVKPNLHKVAGLYLYYFIKSHSFLEGLLNKVNTNTQGNVGINDLKKVKISLPDVQEQGEVVLYLESITKKIDSLSRQAERAITLMNERRTALISAAVTGKIDLRGWTAPTDEVVA